MAKLNVHLDYDDTVASITCILARLDYMSDFSFLSSIQAHLDYYLVLCCNFVEERIFFMDSQMDF